MVANNLFITGANADEGTSKKKELRKENRKRKEDGKGNQALKGKLFYTKGRLQHPWRAA